MRLRRIVHLLCAVVLLGVVATTPTGAIENARRTTHFTFRAPVGLPGVTLAPGSYVFEVMNPDIGGGVVRVSSPDRTRTYALQLTRPVHRQRSGDMKSTITLGEAANGAPQPIKRWFPENETTGREFLY
jgi:hypothetical protein